MVTFDIQGGIIHATFSTRPLLRQTPTKVLVNARLKLREGRNYPVLIDTNSTVIAGMEGLAFLRKYGHEGISRGAFLVSNKLEKWLVKFMLMLDIPEVPIRIFGNEIEAKEWLKAA